MKKKNIFCGGDENGKRKGEKYLEKENIWSMEEKKNQEGKGPRRKRKTEKEKEENNWRRNIFFVEETGRKSRALQEVLADLKIESVNNCILSLTYQALIIICRRSAKAFSFNCRPEFESTARIALYGVY